jgi:hypothetical protein
MSIKHVLFSSAIVVASVSGCAAHSDESESGSAADTVGERHYDAKNCEIFIDKIGIEQGSHASFRILFNVKTLNYRLDGNLVEVGFRNFEGNTEGTGHDWRNDVLQTHFGATDYFDGDLLVNADGEGRSSFTGAFYAKTDKNVYYWFKQADGSDFKFDYDTYFSLARQVGIRVIPTQTDALSQYNPGRCY